MPTGSAFRGAVSRGALGTAAPPTAPCTCRLHAVLYARLVAPSSHCISALSPLARRCKQAQRGPPGDMSDMPAAYRAVQADYIASQPSPTKSNTKHFETLHYSNKWRLGLEDEANLGLAPSNWSVSSAMNDPRPFGRPIFDARFQHSPVGRARGHNGEISDPRGIVSPMGMMKGKGAVSYDAQAFAEDMADETALAAKSAKMFEKGTLFDTGRGKDAQFTIS